MIETNGLSEHQIIEDILQIKKENICRIVVAKGTYIDDSMGNISWHAVQGQEHNGRPKVDPEIWDSFKAMVDKVLQSKQGAAQLSLILLVMTFWNLLYEDQMRQSILFPLIHMVLWNLMKVMKTKKRRSCQKSEYWYCILHL
jgi:hypothetical protein